MEIILTALMIGAIWIIGTFYWLRIIAGAVLLSIWGIAAVGVPAFMMLHYLNDERVGLAVASVLVAVIPAFFWWMTFQAALAWIDREKRFGLFERPWNYRD